MQLARAFSHKPSRASRNSRKSGDVLSVSGESGCSFRPHRPFPSLPLPVSPLFARSLDGSWGHACTDSGNQDTCSGYTCFADASCACDRTLQRAREGRRARSPPSSGQADRVKGCDSGSIFSDGSGLRRAGLGSFAGLCADPEDRSVHGASRWYHTAPLDARCGSADDAGTALAEKASVLGLDGVRERLERRQGKDDPKAYRPPEFEGDEDADESL